MKFAKRFALILPSIGVFLGLAILGWGGAAFFSNPARIALIAAMFAMGVVSLFADVSMTGGVREDRGNRWVLTAFTLIGLVDAYLPAYTDRIGFWTIDGDAIRWVGVAIAAIGGILRLWPVFVLGHRFSGLVAIQAGHTLQTTGIYQVIRHPSYLGLLLTMLGWGLSFRSGVGLMLVGLTIVPLVARIRAEERLLAAEFGEEYRGYVERTWRLIPGMY